MARPQHERQLEKFINALRGQGVLDDNFDNMRNLRNEDDPRCLTNILTTFCKDAGHHITQINDSLNEDVIDYPKLEIVIDSLKGSSSSVSGHRMALACTELLEACRINNKECAIEALRKVKWEFYILQDSFQYIMQMAKAVLANEDRRN